MKLRSANGKKLVVPMGKHASHGNTGQARLIPSMRWYIVMHAWKRRGTEDSHPYSLGWSSRQGCPFTLINNPWFLGRRLFVARRAHKRQVRISSPIRPTCVTKDIAGQTLGSFPPFSGFASSTSTTRWSLGGWLRNNGVFVIWKSNMLPDRGGLFVTFITTTNGFWWFSSFFDAFMLFP